MRAERFAESATENHLSRQLAQTLGQLRQLQQSRQAGRLRPPDDDYRVPTHHDPALPLPGELS